MSVSCFFDMTKILRAERERGLTVEQLRAIHKEFEETLQIHYQAWMATAATTVELRKLCECFISQHKYLSSICDNQVTCFGAKYSNKVKREAKLLRDGLQLSLKAKVKFLQTLE